MNSRNNDLEHELNIPSFRGKKKEAHTYAGYTILKATNPISRKCSKSNIFTPQTIPPSSARDKNRASSIKQ